MGPRWKGKRSEEKALANPISKLISDLRSSLIKSNSQAMLSGCSVLLKCNPEQTELLNQTCFGRPVITAEKDNHRFELSLEEAFYLCFSLKCIKIVGGDNVTRTDNELWEYMIFKRESFPYTFKAYSHLRNHNWVVRSGCQYGADFVAYRHHPSLVHSEYCVLVLSESNVNDRLRVWSDYQSMVRICGSVNKTLLVLHVHKNCENVITSSSPSFIDALNVEERTITRWDPKRCREKQQVGTE
ncbi:tRNA-splicing endonuclease subunit Sen2-1-like [Rutidosis leptorrhynchoides]|uniref:tRNA-splicing endonuclease subunit Sen2-1-like n=1 Tax=Rutidosis leptorrhynchoides TaxID=125765 RepID=UPI003A99A350